MLDVYPIIKSLWRNKTGPLLILVQLMLTIAIISNALFFINERMNHVARPTGIADSEVIKIWMRRNTPDADVQSIVERDMNIIRAVPGVIDASPSSGIPLSGGGSSTGFRKESDPNTTTFDAAIFSTTDHMLATLGLSLVEGRNFREDEVSYFNQAETPIASATLITKALASNMFPDESALGKTIFMGSTTLTVVGVIEQMMGPWPDSEEAMSNVLLPIIQRGDSINYLIRTNENDRHAVMHDVTEKLRMLDDNRLILDEKTLEKIKHDYYSGDHAMIKILALVVCMLVFVNALGVLGLTTFWVNQRRKQIGIRRALGATKAAIMRYFLIENVMLVMLASIMGGVIAYWVSSYTVRVYSLEMLPWYYIPFAGGSVMIITLIAAIVPIRRASLISPVEAVASV